MFIIISFFNFDAIYSKIKTRWVYITVLMFHRLADVQVLVKFQEFGELRINIHNIFRVRQQNLNKTTDNLDGTLSGFY